jgi:peroxiredoxin
LRRDRQKFTDRDVAILVVGPDNAGQFNDYFEKNRLPFTGLPDAKHSVLKLYGQEVTLFKFGRMPAQILIDKEGIARYVHYGNSMADITDNDELLKLVDELEAASEPSGKIPHHES